MKIRKNGVWEDYKYPIYESATDTLTSLPEAIIADGNNAEVLIKGNMQQTGTPTPENPITPSECGELVTSGEHAGQYKIPISSGNTTTPVYLSEPLRKIGDYVDIVEADGMVIRRIKKLELTGEEVVYSAGSNAPFAVTASGRLNTYPDSSWVCNYYQSVRTDDSWARYDYMISANASGYSLRIRDIRFTNIADFKVYLAQQYAAGTPVTVWYVLATPTTETISTPTIPTVAGSQTFDVQTTLKPSSVEITYKGWHKHTPKEYDNGSWS